MKIEIERKFLVKSDKNLEKWPREHCLQGYLGSGNGVTIRIRIMGKKGFLTIKGKTVHYSRPEYEYEIPWREAEEMLHTLCDKPLIEKFRYRVEERGVTWTIDEFLGENKGLLLAEIELSSEEEVIILPSWLGREVTGDHRYYNVELNRNPYVRWRAEEK
ncbi:MAG: CYTH domain-containing protein [Desulfobulbaceae bacterium]|nr:CYTH domain-containing protein [Desulfobulbaceae bacterium]